MGVTVDLYIWSLDPVDDAVCLSPDEQARAARFVYEKHRNAYVAARVGLRKRLATVTGDDPAALHFDYGPQGKPHLPDGPMFNLSHSGGLACLAIHPTQEVGADIEAFRPVEDGIAERFFSAAENRTLAALPLSEREAGFFRCWTRKEAVIKALGGGLSIPLDAFDVTLDAQMAELARLDPAYGHAPEWALSPFQLGPQVMGCVAVKTGSAPLRLQFRDAPEGIELTS